MFQYNPYIKAISEQDYENFKFYGLPSLLDKKIDINMRLYQCEDTALLHAVKLSYNNNQNVQKAILLLKHGADPNVLDSYGVSPLACAVGTYPYHMNSMDLVDTLLKCGADPNLGKNGNTPLWNVLVPCRKRNRYLLYRDFTQEDNVVRKTLINKLIDYKADLRSIDTNGNTLLMKIITNESKMKMWNLPDETILDLCKRCAKSAINEQNDEGMTALMISICDNSRHKIANVMIDLGANIHLSNNNGLTAMDMALATHNRTFYVSLLVSQYVKEERFEYLTEDFLQYLEKILKLPFIEHIKKNTKRNVPIGYSLIIKNVRDTYKIFMIRLSNDDTTDLYHSFHNEYADVRVFDIVSEYLV